MVKEQSTNVLTFPDDIHRSLIAGLERDPHLTSYLDALLKCLRYNLDISPLVGWWETSRSRITYEHPELDILEAVKKLTFSDITRQEHEVQRLESERERIRGEQERLSKSTNLTDPSVKAVSELATAIENMVEQDFALRARYPQYSQMPWALPYCEIFQSLFGRLNPLDCISKTISQMLTLRNDNSDDVSNAPKKHSADRTIWIVRDQQAYSHLKDLVDWLAVKQNPSSSVVFFYLFTSQSEQKAYDHVALARALTKCPQAMLDYVMEDAWLDFENAEVLQILLELPLAASAPPDGPAHLTSKFQFLCGWYWDGVGYEVKCERQVRHAFLPLWRKFFERYRDLRLKENSGRAFAGSELIYRVALTTLWGEDTCYETHEWNCIARSFKYLQPDTFCVLEFFNSTYLHSILGDFRATSDCAELDGEVEYVIELRREESKSFESAMLALVDNLQENGWYQLANAYLSIFLILTAVHTHGKMEHLDKSPKMIDKLSRKPGFDFIEKALDFVCLLAQENDRGVTYALYDQFRQTAEEVITKMINEGESETVEFKATLRKNIAIQKTDKRIENAVLKTIAGFLNKGGGNLLVGVSDDGRIVGVEEDGFASIDKWHLHLKNLIGCTMPEAMDVITMETHSIKGNTVVRVLCQRSHKPIYLEDRESKTQHFYLRRGSGTDQLTIKDAVEYINSRFPAS